MPRSGSHLRHRLTAAATAGLLALTVAACTSDEPEASPPPPTTATPAPTPTATPTPTPTPTPEPEPTSTPFEGGPVLAVKIDHVAAAHPRFGIGSADIVYVDEVEYGLTRLMAVFSTTLPEAVGPVRSARPNDPTILANYGPVALAFSGSSRQTREYLAQGTQINVEDGGGFYRDRSRPAPHNLLATPQTLLDRAGSSEPRDIGFRYGPAPAGGRPATSVSTQYPAARMSAEFDAESGTFEISTGGRVEIDALTGDPVAPTTVVIQKVPMAPSDNVTSGGVATPLSSLVGSGDAIVLREGQVWEGQWTRADREAPTLFTVGGEELTFAPGQTWLWFVRSDQSVTVE
ncbi:MAG: DUF3048 domain-containing protein [Actinomycetia bacterium]|nr:DUF3048 domain-containing protein [Actinomycetes bacterium]